MSATPDDPSPPASDKEHFRYLDALRGWAALSVVLVHSTFLSRQTGFLFNLGYNEREGVQLFYVISAFTLCHSFTVRRRELHPHGNYFLRRFFRIAPLFYLAVLGSLLIYGFGPRGDDPQTLTPWGLGLGLVFLNGWHAGAINRVAMGGWSVADETIFYLVLPLALLWVANFRRSLLLLIVSGVLALALSSLAYAPFREIQWQAYFFDLWFPMQFPIFCLGICAYFFWKDYFRQRKDRRDRKFVSLAWLIVAGALFFLNQIVSPESLYLPCAAFPLLLIALSVYEWPLFVNPVTVFLGRISYSIYLTHFFCLIAISWFHQRFLSPLDGTFLGLVVVFTAVLLLTIPVSVLTYYTVEKPGIRLGRQLIQSREKAPVSARL